MLKAKWGFSSFTRAVRKVAKKSVRAVKKVAKKAATVTKRVGGKLITITTKLFNAFIEKAKKLGGQITAAIQKVNLMKAAKVAMEKFFKTTESCKFEIMFKATVGSVMMVYGFNWGNVRAAYNLLTRAFWRT